MRVVLRVEVEAVKFLKEEPQRLDGLLKRCRGVTDTLAQIRRSLSPRSLVSHGVTHWAQTPYLDSSEITVCQLDLPFSSDSRPMHAKALAFPHVPLQALPSLLQDLRAFRTSAGSPPRTSTSHELFLTLPTLGKWMRVCGLPPPIS